MTSLELSYYHYNKIQTLLKKYKNELKTLKDIEKIHLEYKDQDKSHLDFTRGKIYKLQSVIEDLSEEDR